MIDINHFLSSVKNIADSNPTYRTGGRGADGTCDCIGLIMGAMYENGHEKYKLHSSNYFARFEMAEMGVLDDENILMPGDLVYKAREDSGQLNDRYKNGSEYDNGDRLDYYHVGVVTEIEPLEITHCTETGNANGIAYDTSAKDWTHFGFLAGLGLSSEEEEYGMAKATVYAADGNPVKLRPTPSTKKPYIDKVPVGAVVTVHGGNDEWMQVSYNGKTGYMMTEFLQMEEAENPSENEQEGQQGGYSEGFEEKVLGMLEEILNMLSEGNG